jgi:hypothetical protein
MSVAAAEDLGLIEPRSNEPRRGETMNWMRPNDDFFFPALPLPSWHSSEW